MPQIIIDIIGYIFLALLIFLIGYVAYYFFIKSKAKLIQSITIPVTIQLIFPAVEKPENTIYMLNDIEVTETTLTSFTPIKYEIKYKIKLDQLKAIQEFLVAKSKDIEQIIRLKLAGDENFIALMSIITNKRTLQTGVEKLANSIIEYDLREMEIQ